MKTRLKFHSFPGDLPKCDKIALLENKPMTASLNRFSSSKNRAKSYRKMICMKERAVLKRRTSKEVEEQS